MKYSIYKLETKQVCAPSEDYYARRGDWQTEEVIVLVFIEGGFDSQEEAVQYLKDNKYEGGEFTITISL